MVKEGKGKGGKEGCRCVGRGEKDTGIDIGTGKKEEEKENGRKGGSLEEKEERKIKKGVGRGSERKKEGRIEEWKE